MAAAAAADGGSLDKEMSRMMNKRSVGEELLGIFITGWLIRSD